MNVLRNRHALVLSLLATSFLCGTVAIDARAYDEASVSELNTDATGLALRGHDPVAYFETGVPTAGQAQFQASHRGANYRFASAASLAKFRADPYRYAPQFGGFCAMGVALGKKLDGDPDAWKIVDDRLYLNVNRDVQKVWLENVPGNVAKAIGNWPEIKGRAPKDL
jgi:YHS domain-containing protein